MGAMARRQLLSLYKQLLWHARRFPSVKRAAITEDIRIGERRGGECRS